MARGKNEVVLTISGDDSQLSKTFDNVGRGAKKMGDDAASGASKLDRIGESADNNERKFTGLASGIDGVTTLLSNPSPQELAQGIADVADGIANFGVEFAKTVTGFIANQAKMVATHLANAARMAVGWIIAMGPVALVIAAIAGIIAILAALGVDFGDVVNILKSGWNAILGAGRSVFNWLRSNWPLLLAILTGPFGLAVLAISRHKDKILSFFREMPGKIAGFFRGLPGRLGDIFASIGRAMGNGLKRAWNSTIGGRGIHIPSVGVGPFRTPGLDITIPKLHRGGVMPGLPGSEGLALLQAGERVTPAGASAGVVVNIYVAGSIHSDRDLVKIIRDEFSRGGFRGVA